MTEETETIKRQNRILKIVIASIVAILLVIAAIFGGWTYARHKKAAEEQHQQQVLAEKKKETLMADKNMLHGASECPVTDGIDRVDLGDDSKSVTYSREYNYVNGFDCVADDLKMPDSIKNEIESTTVLAGRQTDDWGDFHASWIAHGTGGLTVTVRIKQNI
jgi:hypothetical protein